MQNTTVEILNAVGDALKSEFNKHFTQEHFSKTAATMSTGEPMVMHASLSTLYRSQSGIQRQGIDHIVKKVIFNLDHLRNGAKLRLHAIPQIFENEPPSKIIDEPPAKIAIYWNPSKLEDEIGIRFDVERY